MGHHQLVTIVAFILLSTVILSKANPVSILTQTRVEDETYRLKNDVVPVSYNIELTIPKDVVEKKIFEGHTEITLKTIPIDPSLKYQTSIELHSKYLTVDFTKARLYNLRNPTKNMLSNNRPTQDQEREMLKLWIHADYELEKDSAYVLDLSYTGQFHDDMYGFYLSYHKDKRKTQWTAATQFEPTHARKVFPCFDEPNLKATFDISITHPDSHYALSNTDAVASYARIGTKMIMTTFERTPVMPTYLLAFVLSKFPKIEIDEIDGISHRSEAQKNLIDTANYSTELAPQILKAMEEFTNVPFSVSGLSKLDQVAIPDFSPGAMENWGLVIYRESALLWSSNESSARDKQGVAATVAHELAHMWFGDLITCDWWSSTWLNEGFATYFQYYALDKIETDWELKNHLVIEKQQGIFNSDSSTSSQPLTSAAFTPTQISNKLGTISYSKGASVIRMVEHIMGEENFFKGIKEYFKEESGHHFKNTNPEDLWNALDYFVQKNTLPESTKLEDIMSGWIEKSGFPVVTVTVKDNQVNLVATRFLFTKEKIESDWYIPISYTTSKEKNFVETTPIEWIIQNETLNVPFELKEESWIILNIQASAYFRVKYDYQLWKAIEAALQRENYDGIHVLNRAQIVDDAMNLARAGLVPYKTAMDVLLYLKKENSYFPWYSAFKSLSYLKLRYENDKEITDYLEEYITTVMQELYESVSFEDEPENHNEIHKKVLALTWACLLNDKDCVKKSQTLFKSFKQDDIAIDPDIRGVVYCTAVRTPGGLLKKPENWIFLSERYKATIIPSEVQTIISALGCTKNETLLMRYLDETINPDTDIRRQDRVEVFTAVISGNPEGVNVGLEFVTQKFREIRKNYVKKTSLATVMTVLSDQLTTQKQIKTFEEFINNNKDELGEDASVAESALETAKKNLEWSQNYRAELLAYFKGEIFTTTTAPTEQSTIVSETENPTTDVSTISTTDIDSTPTPSSTTSGGNVVVVTNTFLISIIIILLSSKY